VIVNIHTHVTQIPALKGKKEVNNIKLSNNILCEKRSTLLNYFLLGKFSENRKKYYLKITVTYN